MRKLLPTVIILFILLVLTSCEFTVRHGNFAAGWQHLGNKIND